MKKNCSDYRDSMTLALGNELGPEELEELKRHLEECPSCTQEETDLRATLREMSILDDVPPPRNFYPAPTADRAGPIDAFRLLPLAWKAVLSTGILALALGLALGWSQLRISFRDGALVAGFGTIPDLDGGASSEELYELEKRLEARNLELLEALERQRVELRSEIEWNLVNLVETGLREHERRMEPRWQLLRTQARSDTEKILDVGLASLHEGWRGDMEELSLAVGMSLARDFEQEERMAVMARALIDVSDEEQTDG